jgi:hypothetical protein
VHEHQRPPKCGQQARLWRIDLLHRVACKPIVLANGCGNFRISRVFFHSGIGQGRPRASRALDRFRYQWPMSCTKHSRVRRCSIAGGCAPLTHGSQSHIKRLAYPSPSRNPREASILLPPRVPQPRAAVLHGQGAVTSCKSGCRRCLARYLLGISNAKLAGFAAGRTRATGVQSTDTRVFNRSDAPVGNDTGVKAVVKPFTTEA